MTRNSILLGAVAAFALAGAAAAQDAPAMSPPSESVNPPAVAPADADARAATPAPAASDPMAAPAAAPSAGAMGADVSTTASMGSTPVAGTVTVSTLTNGPVPDTAENRAKYGKPLSNAGKMTRARGN